jgi:Ca2+-binding EF-hand superfamily protein
MNDTDLTLVLDIVAKRLGAEGIWKRYQLSTEEIELLTALFADTDRDHSGYLSCLEIQKFFGKMGIKVTEAEVSNLSMKYGNKQGNLQLQHFLDLVEDIFVMGNVKEGEVLRTLQELNKVICVNT